MIYLRHRYQLSGLPEPATIAVQAEGASELANEILDEFAHAFPKTSVAFFSPKDDIADVCVLAFRVSMKTTARLAWGSRNLSRARLGIGFFCVDERSLIFVPCSVFTQWAVAFWARSIAVDIVCFFRKYRYV